MLDRLRVAWNSASISLLYTGAAFIYAWSFLITKINPVDMGVTLWPIVVPLLSAVFWRLLSRPLVRRTVIFLLLLFGFSGTLLAINPYTFGIDLLTLGGILRVFASSGLLLMWCEFYGMLPIRKAVTAFASMQIFALALPLFFSVLPHETYSGIALVLPIASAISLFSALRMVGQMPNKGMQPIDNPIIKRDLRWKFVIAAFFCSFAYGLNQTHSAVELNVLSYGLSGFVLLASLLLLLKRLSVHTFFNLGFPLVIAGLVVGAAFGVGTTDVSSVLVNMGYAIMTALFTILLSDRAYRFGIPILWSVGIIRSVLMAGIFIGSKTECVLLAVSFLQGYSSQILYSATLVVVSVALIIWMQDRSPKEYDFDFKYQTDGSVDFTSVEKAESVDVVKRRISERCGQLAEEYRLSSREEEILNFWALGWSAPRIEAALVVSNSTVKTHVRHIYSKLGIHSRDELKILIGVDSFV